MATRGAGGAARHAVTVVPHGVPVEVGGHVSEGVGVCLTQRRTAPASSAAASWVTAGSWEWRRRWVAAVSWMSASRENSVRPKPPAPVGLQRYLLVALTGSPSTPFTPPPQRPVEGAQHPLGQHPQAETLGLAVDDERPHRVQLLPRRKSGLEQADCVAVRTIKRGDKASSKAYNLANLFC